MVQKKFLYILILTLSVTLIGTACSTSTGNDGRDGSNPGNENGLGSQSSQDTMIVKFAHEEAETDLQGLYASKFKELLEEKTNGKVKVEIYPVGTLGTDLAIAEQLQQGVVEFAISSPGTTGNIVPEAQIVALKYLFSDDPKVNHQVLAEGEAFNKLLAEEYVKHNIKVLHFWSEGFLSWTSNKPIHQPEDLKGFKIRTQTSPLMVKFYETFGANPTALDFSEVYSSLQLGMIDGQENPNFFIESTKLFEVQDYLIDSRHGIYVTSTVVNNDFYNSLPEDIKQAVFETIEELKFYAFEIEQELNNNALENMANSGDIEVITLDKEARSKFRELSIPSHDLYVELVGEKGKQILDTLKREIEEAEKGL